MLYSDTNSVLKYMYIKNNFVAGHAVFGSKTCNKIKPRPNTTNIKYPITLVKAKQNYDPIQRPLRQNKPKALKTADSNCLNFKLVIPPHN